MKTILVIGATGDVGKGVVAALLDAGHRVVAASRSEQKLRQLAASHEGNPALMTVRGSVADEAVAGALCGAVLHSVPCLDAVVATVSGELTTRPVFDWQSRDLADVLNANLLTHFVSAKTFIPALRPGALYLSIGGGMADFVFPGYCGASMVQAAQRMLFRHIAAEMKGKDIRVRELIVASMVNGERTRAIADPKWLTDLEIGRHVAAILNAPDDFPGPILTLKSKRQVGQPEPA